MKIGLFLALYSDRTLEEALDAAAAAGCETVEIMSGSWSPHCRPAELLADADARGRFAALVADRGLAISALSCHANPLHPDRDIAAAASRAYRDTVRLAAELGVDTVITFSGCPGESERSLRPSWVTCSWPDDFPETLAWQWDERVLPYWAEAAAFARAHGVASRSSRTRASSSTTRRRCCGCATCAGDVIGVNFDPSHLFWQGMDPLACVRALGEAIFHVHAKDTGFHDELLAVNGVLEPIPGNRPAERSWIFRSVGAGHPVAFWRDLVAALREAGYDGALSIEHEDPLLSREEGLAVAVETLRAALDREVGLVSTEVVVGLDVGTTGVKAVAVAPDGSGRRRRRAGLSALDAPRRLVGAGSRGLVGRDARGARRGPGRDRRATARSRGSGSPARCTASSRSTRPVASSGRRSSGTTSAPAPSAPRSRSGSASTG